MSWLQWASQRSVVKIGFISLKKDLLVVRQAVGKYHIPIHPHISPIIPKQGFKTNHARFVTSFMFFFVGKMVRQSLISWGPSSQRCCMAWDWDLSKAGSNEMPTGFLWRQFRKNIIIPEFDLNFTYRLLTYSLSLKGIWNILKQSKWRNLLRTTTPQN